ncbi:MAG: bifunctional biotin--[acetyl-CoA-carboxylase] ligase/biotin operon repressor BirA [Methylococcales bacterium]
MIISDKHKQTLALLADGKFHSGTELANALGLSRSAIWKHLNSFSELGISHAAVNGKGYKLDQPLQLLAQAEIHTDLTNAAKSLLTSLEIHDQIHSTNSYLVEQAHNQAPSGTVCFAEHQSAGKGRRGRQWVSPYGHNIYLSILWRFQQGPAAISGLSLAIGVAVIRALKQCHIDNIGLKWPNDIYSNGKKLGGILVEVSGETEGPCCAVVGLGLNLYLPESQASGIAQAWTDLTSISEQPPARNQLAACLLNHLLPILAGYENQGINSYLEEWRRYDCLKDKPAVLYIGNQQFTGIVQGIDDTGMLLMQQAGKSVQSFASGEVSFHEPAA